ncbi:MAG: transcription termination factor Rho, partial [Dehalococcoidia bacterium]|nr:transcription termination factor Rho [Dehalococcoidia bacterium]
DIQRSGTRREELLLDENTLRQVWVLRRMASLISADSANPAEATEKILERLAKTSSNAEFLSTMAKDF